MTRRFYSQLFGLSIHKSHVLGCNGRASQVLVLVAKTHSSCFITLYHTFVTRDVVCHKHSRERSERVAVLDLFGSATVLATLGHDRASAWLIMTLPFATKMIKSSSSAVGMSI
jgi:hypothetical protein